MKIPPYDFGSDNPELENFCDSVTTLINYGKYQLMTITGQPTWEAEVGSAVFQMAETGGTTFWFYRNTAWVAGWSVTA